MLRTKVIKNLESRIIKWRQRAKKKQSIIRKQIIRIRDLERSRAKWRKEALRLRKKIKEQGSEKTIFSPLKTQRQPYEQLKGYHYPLWSISLSVQLYLKTSSGFRCVGQSISIMSQYIGMRRMSFDSIRHWVLQLGYYKLSTIKERADDWVYILDHTIQLGSEKCLLILGARLEQMRQSNFILNHAQVDVLDILVSTKSSGEQIFNRLCQISKQTGIPCQIVSDAGHDIAKAIRLFQALYNKVIGTYDVTHKVAFILKSILAKHSQWLALTHTLNSLGKRTQQTDAGFLSPISLRKTARFMNLYKVIEWITKLKAYEQRADFSLIGRGYTLEKKQLNNLSPILDQSTIKQLKQLRGPNKQMLLDKVRQLITQPTSKLNFMVENQDLNRFKDLFQPLDKHHDFIVQLQQLMSVVKAVLKLVKENGFSKGLIQKLEKLFVKKELCPLAQQFYEPFMDYVHQQINFLPDEKAYLATSDIIESIFGRYKSFIKGNWLKGIYSSVLVIAAMVGKLNQNIIALALNSVSTKNIDEWFKKRHGLDNSFLAKRRLAFAVQKKE